jgi:tetratricopeptide (TPR) repeat protein
MPWKPVAGYIALVSGLATLYTAFNLSWLKGVSAEVFGVSLLIVGCVAVGQSGVIFGLLESVVGGARNTEQSFHEAIVAALRAEFTRDNYSDVIRVGEALSRPLFESGAFSTRLQIGRMVEESAARSSRKREQYSALIDSIGWSLVELGRYTDADRQIRHGLRLAETGPDPFYEAKAHRHLGVIARRQGRFPDARELYATAESIASRIADEHDRLVMLAGLQYALASLSYYEKHYEDASSEIARAIDSFTSLGDEYRLNMARVMRGDIEFRQGARDDARDTYRLVLQDADRNKETLQYVRACLGLAEARAADHEWDDVEQALRLLSGLNLNEYKAERERREAIHAMLPRLAAER